MHLPSWSYQESSSFADRVFEWSHQNFGDFPWRINRTPYEILIAELLLKRTTAKSAARVYESFLIRFPTLRDIAMASEGELTLALSGVGLQNQRARAIKRLAEWLLSKHDGRIPGNLQDLMEVPGLGSYSASAILSFGHDVPIAILDANVERILNRVFENTLPSRPSKALLNETAQQLLPEYGHREYNYGLLDLGRLVCRYVDPRCGDCPLATVCDYFARSGEDETYRVENDMNNPPSKLRAIRLDRGLSLKRLAEIAKVSKLTVIRIESGKTSPRRETLEKLGHALQVRPDELCG